jgi:hypothetical protein
VLSPEKYTNLKCAFQIATKKYGKPDAPGESLTEFFSGFKKGSKHFRKLIMKMNIKTVLEKSRQVHNFCKMIDCPVPDKTRLCTMFTNWSKWYLPIRLRSFLFKYNNNILGLNSRVRHFNAEISGECTFCNITGPKPVPLETFVHIFFECPCVSRSIEDLRRKHMPNLVLAKENFFICNLSIFEEQNVAANIFFDIIRYLIWQSKLEKKLPLALLLESNLLYMLKIIVGSNNKIQNYFTNCPFFQNNGGQAAQVLPDSP